MLPMPCHTELRFTWKMVRVQGLTKCAVVRV